MNIAVQQLDGKIPNLAIMKIVNYHKKNGDSVKWYEGDMFNSNYDKVYFSKIFNFTKNPTMYENCVIGGTGIDFTNKLPEEIEEMQPSYKFYENCTYHLGFSMKGCRFVCKFCCVPKKEGRPKKYNTIDEILLNPNGKNKLMLLDNDFFGTEHWKDNLNRIIELKLKVCFVQGLNIRIITKDQAELLSKCNYTNSKFNSKYLTFAWDKYRDKDTIIKGIEICNKAGIPNNHMQFFILVGYDTTPDQDMERIMTLKNLGCKPFVMPYNKFDEYQKKLARWVNHRAIFNTVKFENYKS